MDPLSSQQSPNSKKKGIPTWAKVLIFLFVAGFLFLIVAGIGLTLLGNYLSGEKGQKLLTQGAEAVIEKVIEKSDPQGGAQIDIKLDDLLNKDGKGFTLKDSKTGEEFSIKTDASIPQDFPKDVPLYPQAKVSGSMTMGPMKMLTLESQAGTSDISGFYTSKLKEAGWENSFSGSQGDGNFSAIFSKGESQVTITITPEEAGKTLIVIAYGNLM